MIMDVGRTNAVLYLNHRYYSHDTPRPQSTRIKGDYRRKKRICIVDDEVDVGLALKFILEQNGFRVELFNDPVIGLEIIKVRGYDLFLIDIIMPNMNGFQIFKDIMQINKKAKVCFITAFEEYAELFKDELSSMSISGFIHKPVEGDDLIKRVNKMLSSKQKITT
jgi:DNA-binding NtrC family response regulator